MLWKLSLTGIKGRFKDYLVLFSGLIMSSAIFYMFEALATNKDFVTSNSQLAWQRLSSKLVPSYSALSHWSTLSTPIVS